MFRFAIVNVLLYQPHRYSLTETFIRAHAEYLPFQVTVVHGYPAQHDGEPLLADTRVRRAWRKFDRIVRRKGSDWEMTRSVLEAFRCFRPNVVLAEYGTSGVLVREACERVQVPLVVCFHGFDASQYEVLERNRADYLKLFETAHSVVAVSQAMSHRLVELGAGEKVRLVPYGVDVEKFVAGDASRSAPTFLATGRFVEKKAPYLTLSAFAKVLAERPLARLRMIGAGPLLGLTGQDAAGRERRGGLLVPRAVPRPGVLRTVCGERGAGRWCQRFRSV